MKPENKQFLDDNQWAFDAYSAEKIPRHLTFNDRAKMMKVINDEFDPDYHPDIWCKECIREMVLKAYKHYDEYKQQKIS